MMDSIIQRTSNYVDGFARASRVVCQPDQRPPYRIVTRRAQLGESITDAKRDALTKPILGPNGVVAATLEPHLNQPWC
jgi:hypothetical protein